MIQAFRELLTYEREVEDEKVKLVDQLDFNLYDAFHMIDINNKGCLSAPELEISLDRLGLKANKIEV